MRRVHVYVPVPVYVRKFFLATYQTDNDVIVLRRDESLGVIVESFLEKNFTSKIQERPKECHITVSIYQDAKLLYLPAYRVRQVSKILKTSFEQALIHNAIGGYRLTKSYQPHIESFLKRYGIEPDVDILMNTATKIVKDYEYKMARHQSLTKKCDV